MTLSHGMDVAEVEELALFLQQRAIGLRQIAQEINASVYSSIWNGDEARVFSQELWPRHRARLLAAADRLEGLAQSARNNASEQLETSSVRNDAGVPSALGAAAGGPGASSLGSSLRAVADGTSLGGPLLSALGEVRSSGGLTAAGHAVDGFGYFVEGYTIGEDLGTGNYAEAGIGTALVAGDVTADTLKTKGHVGYAAGAALQTWVEVGREARNVDWSAEGMQAIGDASLGDWGSAFGEAVTKMPTKLVTIFGF